MFPCAAFFAGILRSNSALMRGLRASGPWIVKQCPGSLIKQGVVSHGARLRRVLPFALFVAFRRH